MSKEFDPEKYMLKAIEVMNMSIQEPRSDKTSPKVGAVLVSPEGEVIDSAFRGELRHGDHAEFTLLERKHRSRDLSGNYLFATLEPCAPGARKSPKLGCAERIVNARISKVWIGIEDPDPTVDRKGIKYLEDNGIEVHMFSPQFQYEIRIANKEFLEQAKERAEGVKEKKEVVLNTLENVVPTAVSAQFSEDAIVYYITKAKLSLKLNTTELWEHFESIGLVKREINNGNITYIPTGVGILLFGKNPREQYPNAVVKAKVKYGNNASIPKDFEGPLVLIPQDIEIWLQQILHSDVSRDRFERKTQTLFPLEPLREAIINALVHRDYEMEGAKTFIEIDDDKIVIRSAGLPVSPISLDQVKRFKAPSLSRNPKLTYILNKMGLMEESELGMETFRTMQEKHNLPLPEYDFHAPYLALTFSRSIDAVKYVTGNKSLEFLSEEELLGYEWLRSVGETSRGEYAKHFGFDDKKAYRHLSKLKQLEVISDNGESSKSNKYKYVSIVS